MRKGGEVAVENWDMRTGINIVAQNGAKECEPRLACSTRTFQLQCLFVSSADQVAVNRTQSNSSIKSSAHCRQTSTKNTTTLNPTPTIKVPTDASIHLTDFCRTHSSNTSLPHAQQQVVVCTSLVLYLTKDSKATTHKQHPQPCSRYSFMIDLPQRAQHHPTPTGPTGRQTLIKTRRYPTHLPLNHTSVLPAGWMDGQCPSRLTGTSSPQSTPPPQQSHPRSS